MTMGFGIAEAIIDASPLYWWEEMSSVRAAVGPATCTLIHYATCNLLMSQEPPCTASTRTENARRKSASALFVSMCAVQNCSSGKSI